MKNLKLKLICLLALVLGVLCMAGCSGGVIDTSLTVQDDYSGTRVMEVTIDEEYFASDFHGTYDDLDAVITKNLPDAMGYTWISTTESNVLRFAIDFTSLEDYNNKLYTITRDENVKSDIQLPAGVWSTGYRVSENFNSEALLKWLTDALVAEGYVDADDSSYVFELGSSKLTIAGETIDVYNTISQDTLKYVQLIRIDMFTNVLNTSAFDRTFKFCVNAPDVTDGGKELKKFFEGIIPDGASVSVEENSYYVIFSVTMENLTIEGLETFDKALFTNAEMTFTDYDTPSAFAIVKVLEEKINPGEYIFGEWQSVDINHYINVPSNYGVSNDPDWISNIKYYSQSEEYPGYYRLGYYYSDGEAPANAVFAFSRNYLLSSMEVLTKVKSTSKVEKEITFVLFEEPEEEHLDLMMDKIYAKMSPEVRKETVEEPEEITEEGEVDKGKALSKLFKKNEIGEETGNCIIGVTHPTSKKDTDCKVVVTLKGDPESVLKHENELTGIECKLIVAENSKSFGLKKEIAVVDTFSFWNYIAETAEGFSMTYTLDMGGKKINFCESPLATINKDEVVITGTDVTGTAVTANSLNLMGILVIVLVVAGVSFIALAIIKGNKDPKAVAAREAKKQAKAQPVAEAPAPAPVSEGPAFCTKCGAPRENGSKFCTKCGNPF